MMFPNTYGYLSMDGTDQLPFGFPHFAENSKDEKATRLASKLQIAYAHGVGVWTYDTLANVRGDANLVIECMQRTLKHWEDMREGGLPHNPFFAIGQLFQGKQKLLLPRLPLFLG